MKMSCAQTRRYLQSFTVVYFKFEGGDIFIYLGSGINSKIMTANRA